MARTETTSLQPKEQELSLSRVTPSAIEELDELINQIKSSQFSEMLLGDLKELKQQLQQDTDDHILKWLPVNTTAIETVRIVRLITGLEKPGPPPATKESNPVANRNGLEINQVSPNFEEIKKYQSKMKKTLSGREKLWQTAAKIGAALIGFAVGFVIGSAICGGAHPFAAVGGFFAAIKGAKIATSIITGMEVAGSAGFLGAGSSCYAITRFGFPRPPRISTALSIASKLDDIEMVQTVSSQQQPVST